MNARGGRRVSLIGAFEELPARMGRLDMRDLPMAVQYFIAVSLVAAAIAARLLLDPYLLDRVPYLMVFGVLLVLVVAVCPGPFFAAAIAGGIGTWYFVVPPRGTFVFETTVSVVALGIYLFAVACAAVTTLLSTRRHQREKRMLEAAAEHREALRVTLASIGDGVITTDERGRVEFVNGVAAQLTGWTHEDAAGRSLAEIFRIVNEDTRESVDNPVEKVLKVGQVVGLANHTVLIGRDGRERPIDDSAAPIRDGRGHIVGVVLVFRDVAVRREAEERLARSERELVDFFENATVGMHWLGPDGRIIRVNRAELQMLGYSTEEVVGHNIAEFHVDPDAAGTIFNCLTAGEDLHERPARLRCKDGSIRDVLISSSVYRENGRFVHTRCFTLDVTARKRAEGALRESEERFRLMADAAPVMVWISGPDRKSTWFNKVWLDFVGRTIDQELGEGWTQNIHPDDAERCLHVYNDAFETLRSFSLEYRLRNAAGQYRWVLDTGVPRFDASGSFAGYIGSCIDISDRKEIEVALAISEARFRRIADANLIGVGFGDGQGNVTYVNDEMLRMMGQRREDFEAGRVNWKTAIAPEFLETYRRTTEKLIKEGSVIGYEKAFLKPDGERTYFLGAAALLDPGSNFHVRIALDLTQLRRAQQERERLLDQLRQSDRRKDEFLAVLAHELRNPLAPLKNSLEILKRSQPHVLVGAQAIETMERQLSHMVRLIDDLLDVSRITHNRLELRRTVCDLRSIVEQALQTVRPLADAKSHQLEMTLPDEPIYLDADPVRLTQVLINLLDNACKYTDPGGRVSIVARRQGEEVVIRIEDTGHGIAPDMLPAVFEMFTRADQSIEREQGGLGLGLTLVRRMLELHGGRVDAWSAGRGRGSVFTAHLPALARGFPTVASDGAGKEGPTEAQRILVVDDNRDATETLAALLQLSGHETATAYDGKSAIEIAESFRPDVLLLDIGMPELNGYDVARRVRELPWGADTMLIALTGWGQEDDRRRSQEAGFDAHLVKPVDHAQLMQLLARTRGTDRRRGIDEPTDRAA
ncbi:MAG TPA: PAS domain S-box protein [Burkholderiaceae bacterium]|nr:PAS domain S-box protein [Burkholderiaceae bacterium]